MPKSKEHLHELAEEAISKSDVAVVNFQAFRDLLAALIGHHSDDGVKPEDSSTNLPKNDGRNTEVSAQQRNETKRLHNSLPQTSENVRNSIVFF